MIAALKHSWQSRAPMERRIIVVLAVLVVVLLYVWLLDSAGSARHRLARSVTQLREQSLQLTRDAAEIRRLRARPPAAPSRIELRTLVKRQADAAGLSLTHLVPAGADRVQLAFGAVGFDHWLSWINALQAMHVRVDACRIEALAAPGLVSISATLSRPRGR